MLIDIAYGDEELTYYFDSDKDSGFVYTRLDPGVMAEIREACTTQSMKKGRQRIHFDSARFEQTVWDKYLIKIFGLRARDGARFDIDASNKKDWPIREKNRAPGQGFITQNIVRLILDVIAGDEDNPWLSENGAGPKAEAVDVKEGEEGPFGSPAGTNS